MCIQEVMPRIEVDPKERPTQTDDSQEWITKWNEERYENKCKRCKWRKQIIQMGKEAVK